MEFFSERLIGHVSFNSGYGDEKENKGHRSESEAIETAIHLLNVWKENGQGTPLSISFRDSHMHHGPNGPRFQITLDCFYSYINYREDDL